MQIIFNITNNSDLWATILSWAGAIISLASLAWTVHIHFKENKARTSRFYLNSFNESLEKIILYLKSDQPIRRMAWVTAAEISDHCRAIQKEIEIKADKEIIQIYLRQHMHSLLLIFSDKRNGQYFYGVDDAVSLNDAAEKSKPGNMKAIQSLTPDLRNFSIDESQIISILKLIDPILKKDGYSIFDDNGRVSLNVLNFNNQIFGGLYDYLKHVGESVVKKY